MAEIIWPWRLLKPQSVTFDIVPRSTRSPSAASGFTQTISNSAGIWKAQFSDIPVYNSQMIKCWRAIDALAEGGLNTIIIPMWNFPRSPSASGDYGRNLYDFYNRFVTHSDGTTFSDGSGYQSYWTNVVAAGAGVVGATTITALKNLPAVTLEPGMDFSINSRPYRIKKIVSQTETLATITVSPPIREVFDVGDRLEFDLPTMKAKLVNDDAMSLPLNFNQRSFPTLDFIEDV